MPRVPLLLCFSTTVSMLPAPTPPPAPDFLSISGKNEDAPAERRTDAAIGAHTLETADSSMSRILQKQYEFEQLLMNHQLWAEKQSVKLEVDIKSVALQAAVEATEVRKFLPGGRNDSVAEVVKELNSRRPCIQKRQPVALDKTSSPMMRGEKDIIDEKERPRRGRESHLSSHRRPSSRRGRSRSRSRDRYSSSKNRRDTGQNDSHRQQSRSTRRRDGSKSKTRSYSSRSPPRMDLRVVA